MNKSKLSHDEPKALKNGVFVANVKTLQMVPFEDTSLVMLDMHTVSPALFLSSFLLAPSSLYRCQVGMRLMLSFEHL